MVENNVITANSEEKKSFQIFEINLLILIAVTMGVFGLINSYWMASVAWLSFLFLFGRIWNIDYRKQDNMGVELLARVIERSWRPIVYIGLLGISFLFYNYYFWWWTGFGDINNSFVFNVDALFVAVCIAISSAFVCESCFYLFGQVDREKPMFENLIAFVKNNKGILFAVPIAFSGLFLLGDLVAPYEAGIIVDNIAMPLLLFFYIALIIAAPIKAISGYYQVMIIAVVFLFGVLCAGKFGQKAIDAKIRSAYNSFKGQERTLSNLWWKDEYDKMYYFIHHRSYDSVYFNVENEQFYKCLQGSDNVSNCQVIDEILLEHNRIKRYAANEVEEIET